MFKKCSWIRLAALIYKSFASKSEKAISDIDLIIICSPDTSHLNEKIAALEKKLKREINPTIYSLNKYKTKKRIEVVLWWNYLTTQK